MCALVDRSKCGKWEVWEVEEVEEVESGRSEPKHAPINADTIYTSYHYY
jgi:hypothetical protein